jgi:preprotein translocase subunit SecB
MSEAIQPVFTIDKVYVKDMSLEVPNAPQVFLQQEEPQVQIQLRTDARQVDPGGVFEVAITVTITAKAGEKTIFLIEVAQAGLFQIRNVPQSDVEPLLGIACPNILFPYLRETVASLSLRAGFPPVQLAPMSFESLYAQRQQELAQQAAAAAPAGTVQ